LKQSINFLLEALLQLEIHSEALYKKIAIMDGQADFRVRNVANILAREEMRHADLYRQLIEDQEKKKPLSVDKQLIESAKSELVEFQDKLTHESFSTTKELLEFALGCEVKTSQLLKDILEQLIKEDKKYVKDLMIIFEKLIIEEQRHAHNIKKVIKS